MLIRYSSDRLIINCDGVARRRCGKIVQNTLASNRCETVCRFFFWRKFSQNAPTPRASVCYLVSPRLCRRSCSHLAKFSGGFMISLWGLRLSCAALFGQPVTHSPQPMHFCLFTTATSFCWVIACTWHLVLQVPQLRHWVGSIVAV